MPNDEIDSLVNKYSSGRRSTRATNANANANVNANVNASTGDNNNNNCSISDIDASTKSLELFRTNTDPHAADRYTSGRRSSNSSSNKVSMSQSKKERRKSKRTSSSRTSNNRSPPTVVERAQDMIDFANNNNNNNSSSASSSPNRASVSPGFYEHSFSNANDSNNNNNHVSSSPSIATSYADNRYVLPPPQEEEPEEEHNSLLSESGNADPNDPLAYQPNFRDEFDDEMDQIELEMMESQRANTKTKFVNLNAYDTERSKKAKRRRFYCFCVVFVFLLVGMAAVAYIPIMSNSKSKGADNNNNNESQILQQQSVPTAPNVLKLWCAEYLDLPPGQSEVFPIVVPKDCEIGCLKAECCWNPNSIYECTPETKDQCSAYEHSCKIMVPATVPQAPATLKTTCVPVAPDNLASKSCQTVCALGDCCWNTTATIACLDDAKEQNCAPYNEFCSFLNDNNDDDSSANKDPDADLNLPFPYATDALASYCTVDTMAEFGPQRCQDECSAAECCWKVGTINCESTAPNDMCSDYQVCTVLEELGDNSNIGGGGSTATATPLPFPAAPDGLEVYCNPEEMEEISLHICQQKCSPAACCWSTDAEPCPSTVPDEACQAYAENCYILDELQTYPGNEESGSVNLGTPGDVPLAPTNFAQRCTRENIVGSSTGGQLMIECERDCMAAPCCWQPGVESCSSSNDRCAAYAEPCSMFADLFSSDSGSSGILVVPAAPADLATTCSTDLLMLSAGGQPIIDCEEFCMPAACCWKENSANSCVGADGCAPYMDPCGNHLVAALAQAQAQGSGSGSPTFGTAAPAATITPSTISIGEEAKKIADACNDQATFFVKPLCVDACDPGSCCYDDSEMCALGIDCDLYAPCYVLHP